MPTPNKVLIIGAGLGGLVLAQILQRKGIPFEIFERDSTIASRKQGWAVALVELTKDLPPALSSSIHTNSVNEGIPDTIAFVNAQSAAKAGSVSVLRVSREGFRNFLTKDLPITMNKRFTHYTETSESVTAFFSDGTSSTGSILIGADGAHSHVLGQLTGHHPDLSTVVPIFGEVNLPQPVSDPIRALGTAAILASHEDIRIQIGMIHASSYFWALMFQQEDPKPLSDWVQQATREELFDYAKTRVEPLHESIKNVILHGGSDSIVKPTPKFYEYVPHNLPHGRVTVLGDAAHTMIPFRGAGANTAILDACDLGELLSQDHASVIPQYLERMVPRGVENVLSSRAAAQSQGSAEDWSAKFERQ